MLAQVFSSVVLGVDGHQVDVQVDLSGGMPYFSTVGLPDAIVKESKDRVRAAIKNSGFAFPAKQITVNLAPADVRKEGSGLDLPMGVAILAASGQLDSPYLRDYIIVGELSLDGSTRKVPGVLSMAFLVQQQEKKGMIVPVENCAEAGVVDGIDVIGVSNLREAVAFLAGTLDVEPHRTDVSELFSRRCHVLLRSGDYSACFAPGPTIFTDPPAFSTAATAVFDPPAISNTIGAFNSPLHRSRTPSFTRRITPAAFSASAFTVTFASNLPASIAC